MLAQVCIAIKHWANFRCCANLLCEGTSGWCVMQVGPIVPALLAPLVTKLADSDSSPLVVHLLLVLAQLALINTNQLVNCLAAQPAPGPPASCSMLLLDNLSWHSLFRMQGTVERSNKRLLELDWQQVHVHNTLHKRLRHLICRACCSLKRLPTYTSRLCVCILCLPV